MDKKEKENLGACTRKCAAHTTEYGPSYCMLFPRKKPKAPHCYSPAYDGGFCRQGLTQAAINCLEKKITNGKVVLQNGKPVFTVNSDGSNEANLSS